MKDSLYFSHDSDARNDLKIKALIKRYGMEGYGIFWVILELMRTQENYVLPLKSYVIEGLCDSILKEYDWTVSFIKYCIEIELFLHDEDSNIIWSKSFLERMILKDEIIAKRSLAGKASAKARQKDAIDKHNDCSIEVNTINEINRPITEDNNHVIDVEHMLNTKQTESQLITNTCQPNKENKENKENKKELFLIRKNLFEHEVMDFRNDYEEDMLRDFLDYWTEPNKSGTKMRWELQTTWDLSRRLAYWAKNDKTFGKRKNQFKASDYEN